MRKYIAATLSILVAIGPAWALDVGLGGKAGGVGIGANVGVGSKGASVGVGVNAGQLGGAKAGASAGTSSGSVGANVTGSGKVGGVGIGASASAGSKGASLGVGANVAGVGGATAGTSIGKSGVSLGIGGNIGASSRESTGVRAGSSVGVGAGAAPGKTASGMNTASGTAKGGKGAALGNTARGAPAGSGSAGAAGNVTTTTVISRIAGVRRPIILPPILRPSRDRRENSGERTVGYPMLLPARLRAIPGAPDAVVRACRKAIVSAAKPLGAVHVEVASAGSLSRHRRGALTAPIEVRIDYARRGGIEVRQARVRCRLDATSRVIAVT